MATKTLLSNFIYSPTDALVNCLKNNIKIYFSLHKPKSAQSIYSRVSSIYSRVRLHVSTRGLSFSGL